MYEKIMKCDVCGMTFSCEYWNGGYIDHVLNFSSNAKSLIQEGDANRIIQEIILDGNDVRDVMDIRLRLRCFQKWNAPTELHQQVVSGVEHTLKIIKDENDAVDEAVEGLTDSQKDLLSYRCDKKAFLSPYNGCFASALRDDDGNFRIPPEGGAVEE